MGYIGQAPANKAVKTADIEDSAITAAKIADGTVVAGELASDSVTTAKILNANVTTAKLAADAVDGTKLADDAVDSEHYTDASIDNAHLADDAVGVAELSATGTASSSTFLRGDNSWAAAGGDADNYFASSGLSSKDLGVGLHIKTADSGASVNAGADELVVESSGAGGISILTGNTSTGKLAFGDDGATSKFSLNYDHSTDLMKINTEGAVAIQMDQTGAVTTPLNPSFRVYQSTDTDYAPSHTMYNQNITEACDTNSDLASGTFTAPVTGIYMFTMGIYDKNATDDTGYDMGITTSNRGHRIGNRNRFEEGTTGYSNMKIEGVIIADMDANDTAYVFSGATATITNYANVEHAYFSGVLIG